MMNEHGFILCTMWKWWIMYTRKDECNNVVERMFHIKSAFVISWSAKHHYHDCHHHRYYYYWHCLLCLHVVLQEWQVAWDVAYDVVDALNAGYQEE